jgi:uncharacterized membrane protein YhaH (DUF805 family)
MNWYLKVLRQYADFSGRSRRKEFWMFVLFNYLAILGLFLSGYILELIIGTPAYAQSISVLEPEHSSSGNLGRLLVLLYLLATFIPLLAVMVRRLHDIGKSGWWIFISLIPIAGYIWLIVLLCTDGDAGDNLYGPNPKKTGNALDSLETGKVFKTQQPAPEAKVVRDKVAFDDKGKFVKATVPCVPWNKQFSGGSTYFSCNAPTLFQATEILRGISSIPPNTYYVVDTPDGSVGRDLNGFYTEVQIKSNGIRLETGVNKTTPVEALSLTAFGNVMNNQNNVAFLKSTGQYASLVLQMECGHCGYKSPVETKEGGFERQCYACGTVNKTRRGQIQVYTQRGAIII